MKAAYIDQVGPPEAIRCGELPTPEVGTSDVLVRVSAVAVDPVDTYIRSGKLPLRLPTPSSSAATWWAGSSTSDRPSPGGNRAIGCGATIKALTAGRGLCPTVGDRREAALSLADHGRRARGGGVCRLGSDGTDRPGARGSEPSESIFVAGAAGNVGSAVLQCAVRGCQNPRHRRQPGGNRMVRAAGSRRSGKLQKRQRRGPGGVVAPQQIQRLLGHLGPPRFRSGVSCSRRGAIA